MRIKRSILCVDDDERSLSVRKVMLETRGYRVFTCSDPDEALSIMKSGVVDLVLADLMMPKRSGAQLINDLKELSPETPAILFSGSVKFCNEDCKAELFLPKGSYAPLELLEQIRILLMRKRGPKRAGNRPRLEQLAS